MQLCGSSELDPIADPTVAGTMVFGGIDSSLYDGEMLYTPIVKKWYYEVIITDIAVNTMQESLGLDCKKVYTNVSCYHKTEPAAISV
jgi:beta-site APP-cleaving enzyme 1 (memapsin 2)